MISVQPIPCKTRNKKRNSAYLLPAFAFWAAGSIFERLSVLEFIVVRRNQWFLKVKVKRIFIYTIAIIVMDATGWFFPLQKSTVMSNKFKSNWYNYGITMDYLVKCKVNEIKWIHMFITTVCNYIDQWHQWCKREI